MRFTMPRESYVPKGAVKVADKASDAVAYVYERVGMPYATLFFGKQAKPIWQFRFQSPAKREAKIVEGFKSRQASAVFKAEQKAKRSGPHKLAVGTILKASWGYDQTNVDFYQVVGLIGATMVEVRAIASKDVASEGYSSMAGQCVAVRDSFKGPATRHRVSWGDGVKINGHYASPWNGEATYWSSYA